MKNRIVLGSVVSTVVACVAWVVFGATLGAQTQIVETTLSSAVSASALVVNLTSATGVAAGGYLYVDHELMGVQSVSSTAVTVRRGLAQGDSNAIGHLSGATVYVGAGERFSQFNVAGACTRAKELYLPHINTMNGRIWDCTSYGVWVERLFANPDYPSVNAVRDDFKRGYTLMEDTGVVWSFADDKDAYIAGSPLGTMEYREEQTKTVPTWVTSAGYLDISADDGASDNEGFELVIGASAVTNSYIIAGTSGACFSASVTVTLIAGTDQLVFGFRDSGDFVDVAAYTTYTETALVGINNIDGSIFAIGEKAGGGTLSDDSGVNWANGETRALKVCVNAAGYASAFYSDATPGKYPVYKPITMTNGGAIKTAGAKLIPYISYLCVTGTDAGIKINWLQIERIP